MQIDPIVVLGNAVVFFAAVMQALSGFGYGVVAVPIMTLFLEPKIVSSFVLIHSTILNTILTVKMRKLVDFRQIWPMLIAGIIGVPFGTYLLAVLDPSIIRLIIGVIVTSFAAALLTGFRAEIKNERRLYAPVGFVSGVLNSSITMASPPIVLFLANKNTEKQKFRASLFVYFTLLAYFTLPAFWIGGIISREAIKYTIAFLPAWALGSVAGLWLSHKVDEGTFRKTVLVIILTVGIIAIVAGLRLFL